MGKLGKVGREVVKKLDYQPKRLDFDNTINLSNLIVILGAEVRFGTGRCLKSSRLADVGVVKNVKCRVPSLVKKTIAVGERSFLFLSGTNVPLFQRFFFFGWCGLELAQFERLCVCVRTTRSWSQNFSERDVRSGWRRGGMSEDIYVFGDQG
jgi:hypothetical protein